MNLLKLIQSNWSLLTLFAVGLLVIAYLKFYHIDSQYEIINQMASENQDLKLVVDRLESRNKEVNNSINALQTQLTHGIILDSGPKAKIKYRHGHVSEPRPQVNQIHSIEKRQMPQVVSPVNRPLKKSKHNEDAVKASIEADIENIINNLDAEDFEDKDTVDQRIANENNVQLVAPVQPQINPMIHQFSPPKITLSEEETEVSSSLLDLNAQEEIDASNKQICELLEQRNQGIEDIDEIDDTDGTEIVDDFEEIIDEDEDIVSVPVSKVKKPSPKLKLKPKLKPKLKTKLTLKL